jgi:hypothetical protein
MIGWLVGGAVLAFVLFGGRKRAPMLIERTFIFKADYPIFGKETADAYVGDRLRISLPLDLSIARSSDESFEYHLMPVGDPIVPAHEQGWTFENPAGDMENPKAISTTFIAPGNGGIWIQVRRQSDAKIVSQILLELRVAR